MQTGREFAQGSGGASWGGVFASLLGAIICFTATGAFAEGPLKFPSSQLEPIKWSELAGWTADDHLAAFAAYQASCRAVLKRQHTDERAELSAALSNICRKAANLRPQDTETARAFFEQNFQPLRIGRLGEAEGLLTGYFEPIVAGSRFPSPEFHVPLYRRPRDLVAAGYKPGAVAFPNKGVRIGRRNGNNELVPYHDRGAIEAGALDGQRLEICWLRDAFDLLAIQLEGSGRVILEDGTPLRVSFDSHNGYPYSSIERVLVERNLIPRAAISPQGIRGWMAAHPDEGAKVRATNRSYVFFRVTGLTNEGEPVGAQGVPLTPGRSIAVDRVHEYGTPFFIEADLPIEGRKPASPFQRLMIAQDTGSAIVGPARADLYWGAGDEAGRIAGRIRHLGRFVMLVPRELDIAAAGREAPLPVPKPKIAALDVGKEAGKQDGKGEANSAKPGASAPGGQKPSSAPNTKTAALEAGNERGKGKANSANAGASATGKSIPSPVLKPKNAASEGKTPEGKAKVETVGAGSSAMAAGLHKSSPAPKSKAAEIEVKKQNVKGKTDSANAGEIAPRGKQKPSPAATSKIAGTEVKKPDAKGKAQAAGAGETVAGGKQKPSLTAKSKIPAIEVKKPDAKAKAQAAGAGETVAGGKQKPSLTAKSKTPAIEVKKPDAKGKAQAANAGETGAGGKQKPSPAAKSKTPAIEVKKQDAKAKAQAAEGRVPRS
jgi:membrane-bound lytic murein transglycosylase A